MRLMSNIWKLFAVTVTLAGAALLLGFLFFATVATREDTGRTARADGIVVLTGGVLRISTAGQLLEDGKAKRLLVSGINRVTTRSDIQRLLKINAAMFTCCVDLGYAAQDTRGNADETRNWAKRNKFKSLIVVTASYHMPRSLAELSQAMPDIEFISHPVLPGKFKENPWWLTPSNAVFLAREYLKYLPAAARSIASRLTNSTGDEADETSKIGLNGGGS
jgi:uncharacterized SAM-binding protein YcdF (DUF218 family)